MASTQLNIFLASQEAIKGIQRAADKANRLKPDWTTTALIFLNGRYRRQIGDDPFMVEDVRKAAEGIIPEPPHLRAWGSVIRAAAKNEYVYRAGYQQTKNVNAHRTPASVWKFR